MLNFSSSVPCLHFAAIDRAFEIGWASGTAVNQLWTFRVPSPQTCKEAAFPSHAVVWSKALKDSFDEDARKRSIVEFNGNSLDRLFLSRCLCPCVPWSKDNFAWG